MRPNLSKRAKVLLAGLPTAAFIAAAGVPAASASQAVSGAEHFQIVRISATAATSSVVATGAFTAGGTVVGGNGNNGTSTVTLPAGTFKITHHTVHAKGSVNPRTCLFTVTGAGTYKLGSGTGKYAGITGSGKFVLRILAVDARDAQGKCTMSKRPAAYQQILTLQGTASRRGLFIAGQRASGSAVAGCWGAGRAPGAGGEHVRVPGRAPRGLFGDGDFADLFPSGRGRPSVPASVMASVLVLQVLHDYSDAEAAEAARCDLRWKVACGFALDHGGFDPSTLVYWRRRLARSDRPHRISEAVGRVITETGVLKGRRRRAVDSTILADAVATQDTITQLVAAIRRCARVVPGAAEQIAGLCTGHDYSRPGKPQIDWDDPAGEGCAGLAW